MWEFGSFMLDGDMYDYAAKVYDTGSQYGIDGGRISKLEVGVRKTNVWSPEILVYDREWEIPYHRPAPESEEGKVLAAILEKYPDKQSEER